LLRIECTRPDDVLFLGGGELLAARVRTGKGQEVRVWTFDGKLLHTTPAREDLSSFCHDLERDLVALCFDQGFELRSLKSGALLRRRALMGAEVLALSPDRRVLAAGGFDGALQAYAWPGLEPLPLKDEPTERRIVSALAFSKAGLLYVFHHLRANKEAPGDPGEGSLMVYERGLTARKRSETLPSATAMAIAPSGDRVALGFGSGSITLHKASGAWLSTLYGSKEERAFFAHPNKVHGLAIGPRGWTYSCSDGEVLETNDLRRWPRDAPNSGQTARIAEREGFGSLALSPDGKLLLIGRRESLEVWAVEGLPWK